MSVPTLVGGIALRAYDLPASAAFAAAYGLVVPILVYRIAMRRSFTALLFDPFFFAVERIVVYSLRAATAANSGKESIGLNRYMQASFALGYISLANSLARLIRCVLVNTTNPPPESEADAKALTAPPDATDMRHRFWFRRCAEVLLLLYLPSMILAIIATAHNYAFTDPHNRLNQKLLYASAALGLVLILSEVAILLWAWWNVPRVSHRAVRFLLCAAPLLLLPTCYRLGVLRQQTPDVTALTHAALNTRADKAAFYVVHVLPEWLLVVLLGAVNVKEVCGTRLKGDFRWRDETPEERTKRWAKERAREEKKAMKKMKKMNKKGKGGTEAGFEMTAKDTNVSAA
ncbi:hypothetical protein GGX14DRAFT_637553 [Mycena pura]|uniref:Proteophosphoglycan ppg4 n=1 Tax=Mycena pura TaxID=153505 RepID=A0AAD6V9H8_9AGAR|nr:hypothetical protein GGX14DRAFT_637553 [Mycena pura]